MQKFTNLIYLFLLVFTFTSCTKDKLSKESNGLAIPQTTSSNKISIECPEIEGIAYSNLDLFDYFGSGIYPTFGPNNHGTIDAIANCPNTALEYCERACSGFPIVTFSSIQSGGYFNTPWQSGNEFTVTEQEAILDAGLSEAIAQAPTCPNTNIKMKPVSYDYFINIFLCCPIPDPNDPCCQHYYEIGVHVKYAPPCGRFEVQ